MLSLQTLNPAGAATGVVVGGTVVVGATVVVVPVVVVEGDVVEEEVVDDGTDAGPRESPPGMTAGWT